MELTLFGGAFLAGVLSFLSPCVLPLLPTFSLILAKNSQQDGREAQRLYVNTAAFLAGFTVVFVLLGATASLLGAWLFSYQEILRQGAALLVILMGLFMTGWLRIPLLLREYRPFQRRGFDGIPPRLRLYARLDAMHRTCACDDPALCRQRGDRRGGGSFAPRLQHGLCRTVFPAGCDLAAPYHEAARLLSVSAAHSAGGGRRARPPRHSALGGWTKLSRSDFVLGSL